MNKNRLIKKVKESFFNEHYQNYNECSQHEEELLLQLVRNPEYITKKGLDFVLKENQKIIQREKKKGIRHTL